METKTREIYVAGVLYTVGKRYILLQPVPIEGDSWQRDRERRFLVTPWEYGDDPYKPNVYPPARHVVSNTFTVDFDPSLPAVVTVKVLNDHDVLPDNHNTPPQPELPENFGEEPNEETIV